VSKPGSMLPIPQTIATTVNPIMSDVQKSKWNITG